MIRSVFSVLFVLSTALSSFSEAKDNIRTVSENGFSVTTIELDNERPIYVSECKAHTLGNDINAHLEVTLVIVFEREEMKIVKDQTTNETLSKKSFKVQRHEVKTYPGRYFYKNPDEQKPFIQRCENERTAIRARMAAGNVVAENTFQN